MAIVRCHICRHEQEESSHWQSFADVAPRRNEWRRRTILPDAEKGDDGKSGEDEYDADYSKELSKLRSDGPKNEYTLFLLCWVREMAGMSEDEKGCDKNRKECSSSSDDRG